MQTVVKEIIELKEIVIMNLLKILSVFLTDDIYYINGSETLPPPLPPERENELLDILASRSENEKVRNAKNELIEHNLRLVVYIARKFENTGINLEDLISIGTIGLIKAINTFRPDKNIKLATYSSRCIENEILMFLRKTNGIKNEISIEEPLNVDWDGNELLLSDILGTDENEVSKNVENEAEIDQLRKALSGLNEREQQIMSLRFGLIGSKREYTQKEVADMLGISQSYISRLEKKILEKLKDQLTV